MTINSAAIVAEIEALRSDLRKVTAAIEIVGKAAVRKAHEIKAALEAANDRLTQVLADEALTARKERLARFSDIAVAVSYPNNYAGNLLRASFIITYTKLSYDSRQRQSVPQRHTCNGFATLPDDAWEYLATEKPEAVPAEIMALAPGDVREAFRLYFLGKRRGAIRPAAKPLPRG